MRILVVDDEPKLASVVARALREDGHAADVASRGEDVLWMAQATPYDAIVLDVMLPGVDGLEVLRRLRHDEVWTPVLLLTGRRVPSRADHARQLGLPIIDAKPIPRQLEQHARRAVGECPKCSLRLVRHD